MSWKQIISEAPVEPTCCEQVNCVQMDWGLLYRAIWLFNLYWIIVSVFSECVDTSWAVASPPLITCRGRSSVPSGARCLGPERCETAASLPPTWDLTQSEERREAVVIVSIVGFVSKASAEECNVMAVLLTGQLSVWSGLWGRMKDMACSGPWQLLGLKVELPQLVRITKKCVGMGASFLERRERPRLLFFFFFFNNW